MKTCCLHLNDCKKKTLEYPSIPGNYIIIFNKLGKESRRSRWWKWYNCLNIDYKGNHCFKGEFGKAITFLFQTINLSKSVKICVQR